LALQNLWLEEDPRTLWVDAVCIDQADDEERSEQVQMMSRIYKNASRVLVWLGLPFERTYTEFDAIQKAARHTKFEIKEKCKERQKLEGTSNEPSFKEVIMKMAIGTGIYIHAMSRQCG
jgi:hypothetical protein